MRHLTHLTLIMQDQFNPATLSASGSAPRLVEIMQPAPGLDLYSVIIEETSEGAMLPRGTHIECVYDFTVNSLGDADDNPTTFAYFDQILERPTQT